MTVALIAPASATATQKSAALSRRSNRSPPPAERYHFMADRFELAGQTALTKLSSHRRDAGGM